ncbi:hypothetical protein T4E_11076 [Trichinella pseudospiralis]|uniref:Uncharacterized protein n=1 Tax=Trichinella pseudospiralis TaxID=6337 RepID=A0A0V0XR98_TRIPS|nr:hypothetical protein T4E_11076 [Trichinella pseudospiralis]
MIRHRYGDCYLHNGALEISFRGLELSEDLLLIDHKVFVEILQSCAIFLCFGLLIFRFVLYRCPLFWG